jgi:hypothetical protein
MYDQAGGRVSTDRLGDRELRVHELGQSLQAMEMSSQQVAGDRAVRARNERRSSRCPYRVPYQISQDVDLTVQAFPSSDLDASPDQVMGHAQGPQLGPGQDALLAGGTTPSGRLGW